MCVDDEDFVRLRSNLYREPKAVDPETFIPNEDLQNQLDEAVKRQEAGKPNYGPL